MAYCRECGAYLPEGFENCPACGVSVKETPGFGGSAAAQESAKTSKNWGNGVEAEVRDAAKQAAEAAKEAAKAAQEAAREIRRNVEPGYKDRRGADRYENKGKSVNFGADCYSKDGNGGKSADFTGNYDGEKRNGAARYVSEYDEDVQVNRDLAKLCYLGPLLLIPLLTKPNSQFLRYHCNQGLALMLFAILVSICDIIPGIGWIILVFGWIQAISWMFKGISNAKKGLRRPLPVIGDITLLK